MGYGTHLTPSGLDFDEHSWCAPLPAALPHCQRMLGSQSLHVI